MKNTNEPYYSFNRYLREKFGERVHRLSIDAGFHCPNIDGSLSGEGCIYCSNKGFSHFTGTKKDIETQITESIDYYRKKLRINKFIAYFQAFSNTYADCKHLEEKYDIIRKFPEIGGIFISTRPDCIDKEKLELISAYKNDYLVWIEYGLQTTNNRTLKTLNRNHTYELFWTQSGLREIRHKCRRAFNFRFAMANPGGNHAGCRPAFKAGHPGCKVAYFAYFKDTQLHEMYKEKIINLISEEEYVTTVCDFLERIPDNMVVLRLVSSCDKKLLVAPLWMNNKNSVIDRINKEFSRRNTRQGYLTRSHQEQ
jgi:radical SAM protein (TIGR01212 family)